MRVRRLRLASLPSAGRPKKECREGVHPSGRVDGCVPDLSVAANVAVILHAAC